MENVYCGKMSRNDGKNTESAETIDRSKWRTNT